MPVGLYERNAGLRPLAHSLSGDSLKALREVPPAGNIKGVGNIHESDRSIMSCAGMMEKLSRRVQKKSSKGTRKT